MSSAEATAFLSEWDRLVEDDEDVRGIYNGQTFSIREVVARKVWRLACRWRAQRDAEIADERNWGEPVGSLIASAIRADAGLEEK